MFLSTQMTSAFTQSCVIFISCHVFFRPSMAVGAEIRRIGWINPHKAVVITLKWGSAHSTQNPVRELPHNRVPLFLFLGRDPFIKTGLCAAEHATSKWKSLFSLPLTTVPPRCWGWQCGDTISQSEMVALPVTFWAGARRFVNSVTHV